MSKNFSAKLYEELYIVYHSVCPFVGIGSPHPLPT
jgi:hypothetical protein